MRYVRGRSLAHWIDDQRRAAVAIGTAALIAIGDNDPKWESEYNKLHTTAGAYDDWHEGQDPAGIAWFLTRQHPRLGGRGQGGL